MIRKTVKYKDFEGESHQEVLYFNLRPDEALELELRHQAEGGFVKALMNAVEALDGMKIKKMLTTAILDSYGKKTSDGKGHMKNPVLREEFECSQAYSALFMDLLRNPDDAAAFINGIMPAELVELAKSAELAGSDGAAGLELVQQAADQADEGRGVVQRVTLKELREMPQDQFNATMEKSKNGEVELVDQ